MASVSILPTLAPPEYLHQAIQAGADINLKFYSDQLGIKTNLKRIPDQWDGTEQLNRPVFPRYTSEPFVNTQSVRAEAWSNCDLIKSSKKRRWKQFKRGLIACIKSIKFRFAVLGLLVGWFTSLGALIPILVLWLESTPTNSTSSSVSAGFSLNVSTVLHSCTIWYCQERVLFSTNTTITSFSLIVTVQAASGEMYHDLFDDSPAILGTQMNETTQIIYTFVVNGTLASGDYVCGAGYNIAGLNRTATSDTYVLAATSICGTTKTISGTF